MDGRECGILTVATGYTCHEGPSVAEDYRIAYAVREGFPPGGQLMAPRNGKLFSKIPLLADSDSHAGSKSFSSFSEIRDLSLVQETTVDLIVPPRSYESHKRIAMDSCSAIQGVWPRANLLHALR